MSNNRRPQTDTTTCVLVDDHPAILASLAAYLLEEAIDVVGQAGTGADALRLSKAAPSTSPSSTSAFRT